MALDELLPRRGRHRWYGAHQWTMTAAVRRRGSRIRWRLRRRDA